MAIRYTIAQLRNPQDPSAPKKFYLIEKSLGNIDRKYLINDMVRNTSLTPMEAATGIDYLFSAIPRLIELGFTIQLGELGYFRIGISSEGSDTKEEATPDKIKTMRLRFIPGKEIRKRVKDLQVEKHFV